MIQKVLISKAVELLSKQFKLDKILEYVFERNELDEKCDQLEKRVSSLEIIAHAPRDFVVCEQCKSKIKENLC